MEPMRPETKARILQENPQAEPGEIEEYELLLSRRFTMDPDLQGAPEAADASDTTESRLAELHRKLFPDEHGIVSR